MLLPGLVDTHVHVNEPGRTEWEGFATATRAAAAGGVTTIVDMPLNSHPADRRRARRSRSSGASREGQCHVDVGLLGRRGARQRRPTSRPLHDAGVFGFKCFLIDSGVDEFPPLDRRELAGRWRELAGFDALLIVHAEDPGVLAARRPPRPAATPTSSPRGRARPRTRRSPAASTAARRPAPGCTSCTCPAPTRCR